MYYWSRHVRVLSLVFSPSETENEVISTVEPEEKHSCYTHTDPVALLCVMHYLVRQGCKNGRYDARNRKPWGPSSQSEELSYQQLLLLRSHAARRGYQTDHRVVLTSHSFLWFWCLWAVAMDTAAENISVINYENHPPSPALRELQTLAGLS